MKNLEVLAPAGNEESFMAAINSGADAIYLGLSNFNARARAQNFTTDNIREYTRLAHLFGVKIYLTVNTLVNDDEMSELVELVKSAVKAKVDAFIIQDLGVASVLKQAFPNIVLHASTQMGIHNLSGARIAEKLGFKRIVLSRETTLEDIKEIKQNTNLEIEYFVQGALCVSFSGNCYFSSIEHNKSGNRGECLQLCRLPYSYDGKNFASFLSPADLCLIKSLKELSQAGVMSFKIEGRMRRPAYVAQSVQSYRKAIDALDNGEIDYDKEMRNLAKVYNRGNYIERVHLDHIMSNNIINEKCNNHIGVTIGKVLEVSKFKDIYKITMQLSHDLKPKDGLKFFYNDKEVGSLGVGNVEKKDKGVYVIYSKTKPQVDCKVNLILDYDREQYLTSIKRKIDIVATITAEIDEPLSVELKYNDLEYRFESEYICPQAINSATTSEEIIKQFNKVGDTLFNIKNIDIITSNVFIPKSIINELRRLSLQSFEDYIINETEKDYNVYEQTNYKLNKPILKDNDFKKDIIIIDNINSLKKLDKNNLIVYSPLKWEKQSVMQVMNLLNSQGYLCGLYMPLIASKFDKLIIDDILSSLDFKPYIMSNNLWSLEYINNGYNVIANYNHNIFNSFAMNELYNLGVMTAVQSFESKSSFMPSLYGYNGRPTLMHFKHCPYKVLHKNSCSKCEYNKLSLYNEQKQKFELRRTQLSLCVFELLSDRIIKNKNQYNCFDLRDLY